MKNQILKTASVILIAFLFIPKVFADDPPTVPGTPVADFITFTKAEISWTASTDDLGVTGYKVYRGGIEQATVTGTSYTDTGLASGTEYVYTVKAVDTINQLSDASDALTLSTLTDLEIDNATLVQQVVDTVDLNGLTASQLITAVQNAFTALGEDPTFDKVDVTLLTEVVQKRIDTINLAQDPETPESRTADKAAIDAILLNNFGGHSFIEMYNAANMAKLAEKHRLDDKPDSALEMYESSLTLLPESEAHVAATLSRMSLVQLNLIDEETEMQDIIDILHSSKNTMMRFFDYFPNSTSRLAKNVCVKAAFDYFKYFPELLPYSPYNQDVYDAALALIQKAKDIDDSAINATRLERINSWELSNVTVAIQDPSGNPLIGEINATNVSDSSRFPEDPIADSRIFTVTAASTLTPLYLGHSYDLTVKVDVEDGNRWIWNLSDVPHAKGKKYTYDHGTGPVVTDLADAGAPAQIVVISSQPTAPYNLSATRFVNDFTLNWDWVAPAGFDLKEFKVYRSGTAIGTVTTQSLAGIAYDIGNNTYTYTVIAYDQNDVPSDTSLPLTVTPEFTEQQQAYYDWKVEHFGTDPINDFDDEDSDGIANYFEFLLGSDPNLAPVADVKSTIADAVNGLFAEYYAMDSTAVILPDFEDLTPASSEVLTSFNFSDDADNILGSGISDHVAVRLTGYIDVPIDGRYRFYLNSDDGSMLYIDGELLIDNDGKHLAREYPGDIFMRAGVHAIEIQYYDYNNSGTLEVDWSGPGLARTALSSSNTWYTPNPTGLLAESLAQNRDSDNDGLIDMLEYQLGTKVDAIDSDSDGISDLDEVNITGTDPLNDDTDGDSFSDFDEVFVLFSDPNVVDVSNTVTDVLTVDGNTATIVEGEWQIIGSALAATGRNGTLEYTLNVPSDGVYRLAVEVTEDNPYSTSSQFVLGLTVDNTYVSTASVIAPYGTTSTGHFYLPHLTSGNHTFKLKWDNVNSNTFLKVIALKLQSLGGPDNDSNGIPDWIDNRLAKLTELTVPATSPISPVCVEGANQLNIGNMLISGYYTDPGETPVDPVVKPSPDNKWYSDISISPTAATVLTFDYQNSSESVPKTVTWTETNAMLDDDTMVRVNDSLLISGFPEGAVSGTSVITVEGNEYTIDYDSQNSRNSVAYKFENPGVITVDATYTPDGGDPVTGSMDVKVVNSYFATAPVGILNEIRSWINPNITTETIVKADSYINMFETDIQPSGRDLDFQATQDKTGYVIARLGDDGPILDSEEIEVIEISSSSSSGGVQVIETFEDGTVLIENSIVLSEVPDDISVYLKIFVGGHTFEDGTIEKWLTKDDFDEFGVAKYRILRDEGASTGVCHKIEIYQDGVLLEKF